jgi:hypothetical protein
VPVGPAIRRVLGARQARTLGRWYRAIFVDLAQEAAAVASVIPQDAHLLDVGGGDGEPLNPLLTLRSDIRITTIDPGPAVGLWIEARFDARVTRLPRTTLADYLAAGRPDPHAVLIADVVHHIPEAARAEFLAGLKVLLERVPRLRIIVKDVEPGSWRALFGYWSDRYVSGDAHVSPISRQRLVALLQEALGPLRYQETGLFQADRPNYAIAFFR